MNFSTPIFILFFLPFTLAVFHGLAPKRRVPFLLLMSMVFYGASGLIPLSLLIGVVAWSFLLSKLVDKNRSLSVLWFTISVPLLTLIVTKYSSFILSNIGVDVDAHSSINQLVALTLPAGISFYTFQIMSYLIDIRDGKLETEHNWIKFAAFVSFFPQLIAGPILHYVQIRDQLTRLETVQNLEIAWMKGVKYCVFGLIYKVVFADVLHNMHGSYHLAPNAIDAGFSVFAYTAIIYFDFWGYSLIAMGIGVLFGITLPRNFAEPYKSKSPQEFWRRWHVTLSFWLRDNVYIKLGGNHHYVRNIIIVFLLCGLWHGAGWSFVVWGAYHAVLVVGYHYTKNLWANWPDFTRIGLTFLLVTLGWPLFYLEIGDYALLYKTIFIFAAETETQFRLFDWAYLACVYVWIFGVHEDRVIFAETRRTYDHPLLLAVASCLAIMMFDQGRTFIYFQF